MERCLVRKPSLPATLPFLKLVLISFLVRKLSVSIEIIIRRRTIRSFERVVKVEAEITWVNPSVFAVF